MSRRVDAEARSARARVVRARVLLVAFVVALALIAFWPSPVDRGATGLLSAISDAIPVLTYDRIEFSANVALFIPWGWWATRAWPRWHAFVVPAALAISLVIEVAQGALLDERTASAADVVANTSGAVLGWLLARAARAGLRAHEPATSS